MSLNVLLMLSQSPFDPASGAAKAERCIGELLAEAGFRVRALSTSASEHERPMPHEHVLSGLRISPEIDRPGRAGAGGSAVWRFARRGIEHTMLDVGQRSPWALSEDHHAQMMGVLRSMIAAQRPDVVLGYGGRPAERERRALARGRDGLAVMTLHNWGYLGPGAFEGLDRLIAPSRFIAQRYTRETGASVEALPMPVDEHELVLKERRPSFVTLINPSADKGAVVAARIIEDICAKRSDIPFLIVSGRSGGETLIKAGLNGGFDLRRHAQVVLSPGAPDAGPIFAVTKLLLVPSVWEEPGARVAAESVLLGVPLLVSDRGGTAETARGGAIVLPVPAHVDPDWLYPITSEEAAPWVQAIEHLWDDRASYQGYCWRAAAAGKTYARGALREAYASYFAGLFPAR